MAHSRVLVLALFAIVAIVATSCAGSPTGPGQITPTDLVTALRQQGLTAARVEQMPHASFPFFAVDADRLLVNGESVHVFEYSDADGADRDARSVSSDGMAIGTSQVGWIGTPHFYKRSSTIVLYVGRTPEVIQALLHILGPSFGGGM